MLTVLAAGLLQGRPSGLPVIPPQRFDVTAYGAVGDGSTDNTRAIQAALSAAATAGGGTVTFPAASGSYRSGPLTVSSRTALQLDAGATLQALPFERYPNSTSAPSHFITVSSGSTHVAITGSGRIDGDGTAWWLAYRNGTVGSRPRLIQVNRADIVLVSGVTLANAAQFHLAFNATNNVTIDGVTITSPETAPNSDGIDPAGQHYLIKNCAISVGDDNIAIKPGSTFCSDITIVDCAFGTGHGLSIGGQTNVGLDGLVVDRCTFENTTSGLRLKADATQGGLVQNLSYSNITMTNVRYPIVFYSYYVDVGTPGATSGSNQTTPAKVAAWNATPPNPLTASTISRWRNITLSNVTATGATGYSVIWGLPLADALIANVTLDNVRLSGAVGLELFNATDVRLTGDCRISVPDGVPPIITYNALAFTVPPRSQSVAIGGTATFTIESAGVSGLQGRAPTCRWFRNGRPLTDGTWPDGVVVSGAATATLQLHNVQPSAAGSYTATLANALDTYDASVTTLTPANTAVSTTSPPALLTVSTTARVSGAGRIVATDIVHPNGHVFDQVLLEGSAATVTAAAGKTTRASFIDLDGDIVQVEFSGAGSLSIVLDQFSGPAAPVHYDQPAVRYATGHASLVIADADETTNVSVFSVGRATAVDPTGAYNVLLPISPANDPMRNGSPLFNGQTLANDDGVADIASLAIHSTNGKFGGVRTANASYFAASGLTGLYAPAVAFSGPVYIGNLSAFDEAAPVLQIGSAPEVRITGGDLWQANSRPVEISGLSRLTFSAGSDSHGRAQAAQANRAVLRQSGRDVTAEIPVGPGP